jgi:hypothetical protein
MSETSLKVTIAGRAYPLTVKASEEPQIREAEKQIEESVALFQQNYAVKDKQDLLAMAALQLASRRLLSTPPPKEIIIEKRVEKEVIPDDLTAGLHALENLVDTYLG